MAENHSSHELIRGLERTRDETLEYFALGESDLNRTYGSGKWSVRFILHHLADAEMVLCERIKRVISEPRQTLKVFEESAWADELDYSNVPLDISRDVYTAVRRSIMYLAPIHYESNGDLEWVHSVTGVRTLKDEFDKVVWHNENHLQQIRTALK